MNNEEIHDVNRISDPMSAQHGIALLDGLPVNGRLLVQRFTPPGGEERREIARGLSRLDVADRLTELRVMNRRGDIPHVLRRRHLVDALQWAPEFLVEEVRVPNLITQVGDQYYGERASGVAGPPGQVTGMKLGIGSTAPAKTGAGAALVTYQSGSQKAIDGSFPTSALNGASREILWKTSWGAGVINGVALREAVIINDVLADATSSAANTISRALFGPMTLGLTDTLAISWAHLLLGA